MVKTLTVSIDDVEKAERISISGTLDKEKFNTNVVLNVGQYKIQVDSQLMAQALAEIVHFQQRFEVNE